MSILLGPLLAGMLSANAPLDERAHFVAVARELKFFSAHGVLYDRVNERFLPKDWAVAWREAHAVIATPHLDTTNLLRLLQDKNPKVRTLALASLFHREDPHLLPRLGALMQDKEKTAPTPQPVAYTALRGPPPPPPLQDQTVGQVATQFVQFWLMHANHRAEDFDAYWTARKDRAYCASWFFARLVRLVQNRMPLDKVRADRVRSLRNELDRLPPLDRDWTLLWLISAVDTSASPDAPPYLATAEDLSRAGKRLGPERLMDLLQGKEISGDPDLGTDQRSRAGRQRLILYVLRRAGALLRPTDADAVLALEKTFRTPWCAIAAVELQPDKAPKVLRDAMSRFAGDGHSVSWHRAELAAALWRLAGEAEIGYLTDWFYGEKVDLNPCTTQTQLFLQGIVGVRAPADRNLVSRLIADPRLDKLDYHSLGSLVQAVNRWVKTPLLPPEELHSTRYWRGENVQGLVEWRRKLRESVPEWKK